MSDKRIKSEAELIAMLAPLTVGATGALGLKDDCARLTPRPGYDLILKTDPVRAGVHFFADDPPDAIAWKALAVNVSDIVAKGADPLAYLMALSFPEAPTRQWMDAFARGLMAAQSTFGCHLIGGDTDRAPGPLSVGVTVIGEVPAGRMVQRATARAGDAIYVSGTLGDAGLGLSLHREARDGRRELRDRWGLTDDEARYLEGRYLRPQPKLPLRRVVRDCASAAMDVSDGLVKDLERMCAASGVGAVLQLEPVIFSAPAWKVLVQCPDMFASVVTAGDDYEILAAVAAGNESRFALEVGNSQSIMRRIGTFVAGEGVTVTRGDGTSVAFDRKGWDHF